MECSFQVGQKVVCVKSLKSPYDENQVVKGENYVIREIFMGKDRFGNIFPCVRLNNIICIMATCGVEQGWDSRLFHRLVTTDISVFTAMLANQPSEMGRA
jgi:hypothetical protein